MKILHLLIRRIEIASVSNNKQLVSNHLVSCKLFCKDDDDGGLINEAFDDQLQNLGKNFDINVIPRNNYNKVANTYQTLVRKNSNIAT